LGKRGKKRKECEGVQTQKPLGKSAGHSQSLPDVGRNQKERNPRGTDVPWALKKGAPLSRGLEDLGPPNKIEPKKKKELDRGEKRLERARKAGKRKRHKGKKVGSHLLLNEKKGKKVNRKKAMG